MAIQATVERATADHAPVTGAANPTAHPVIHPAADPAVAAAAARDLIMADELRRRETFIPLTKSALMRRLTVEGAWPDGDHHDARKFYQYLDHWRRQLYNHGLREIDQAYEAFSPDTDLLNTRVYTEA
jgi:hypothetical protein